MGHLALQMLKAWGFGGGVTAACSTDAADMVLRAGADEVLDYKEPGYEQKLKERQG